MADFPKQEEYPPSEQVFNQEWQSSKCHHPPQNPPNFTNEHYPTPLPCEEYYCQMRNQPWTHQMDFYYPDEELTGGGIPERPRRRYSARVQPKVSSLYCSRACSPVTQEREWCSQYMHPLSSSYQHHYPPGVTSYERTQQLIKQQNLLNIEETKSEKKYLLTMKNENLRWNNNNNNNLQDSKSFVSLNNRPSETQSRMQTKTTAQDPTVRASSQASINQNTNPTRKKESLASMLSSQVRNVPVISSEQRHSFTPPLPPRSRTRSPLIDLRDHRKVAFRLSSACNSEPVVAVPIADANGVKNNSVYVPASILHAPNTMLVAVQQESFPTKRHRVSSQLEKQIAALELQEVKIVNDNLQELQEARRRLIYDVLCAKTHDCNSLGWRSDNQEKNYETFLLMERRNETPPKDQNHQKAHEPNNQTLNGESLSSDSSIGFCNSKCSRMEQTSRKEEETNLNVVQEQEQEEQYEHRNPSSIANLLFLKELPYTSELERLIHL